MISKPVIILGAGGHAKVVAEMIRLLNLEILGFVTPDHVAGSVLNNSTVLGDDSIIFDYSVDDIDLVNGVGALPGQNLRWDITSEMREKGYHFITTIHPNAFVSTDVVLEEGVQVMAGAVIQSGTIIGRDSIINTGAIIDHDCIISANCHLAPGVICSGGVSVGANTHIGTGARTIQGINIGARSIIAAGSTIYKNVPADMLVKQLLKTVMESVEA